jgi:hypothetical protein
MGIEDVRATDIETHPLDCARGRLFAPSAKPKIALSAKDGALSA